MVGVGVDDPAQQGRRVLKLHTALKEGQQVLDEPVYLQPKAGVCYGVMAAVSNAMGGYTRIPRPIFVGYKRVKLRWIRPEGK